MLEQRMLSNYLIRPSHCEFWPLGTFFSDCSYSPDIVIDIKALWADLMHEVASVHIVHTTLAAQLERNRFNHGFLL